MAEDIVAASNVVKRYGSFTALNNLTLRVKRGEIYGLVGDNGAGKSTLFKLLTGRAFPTSGEIALFGEYSRKKLENQRKRMGSIVENPGYYPQLSVETNLEIYRLQKGVPGKDALENALKTVQLYDARKKRCKDLSLGMRQRFGLAVALLGEPELLILDEPINGLDPSGVIEMRNLLRRLNEEKNITIILSSHILSEMERLATMYGFLSNGQLLKELTAEELQEQCASYLEILVSDSEKYAAFLEKELNHSQYKIMPDHSIRIIAPQMPAENFSGLASRHGMAVQKLEQKHISLEDYYVALKNKGA